MTPQEENEIVSKIQMLLENKFPEAAQQLINANRLKYRIEDNRLVNDNDDCEPWLKRFVTVNKQMLTLKDSVRKLSKVNDEVLIHGETGTGKEILAHALHGMRDGNFLALNCAGLPEQLIESELFGHARGSFTGAISDKVGMTVAAKNGTLFMDEIGELPLLAQSKLLRVLQEKKIRPVGSNETKEITCRFVFATNRNLKSMCKSGEFRTDLYARLSVFELNTLPLKERIEDVIPILRSLGAKDSLLKCEFKPENLEYNVRSLQQAVRRHEVLGTI